MSPSVAAHTAPRQGLDSRKLRLIATAGAGLAGLAVFVVVDGLLGVDVRQPAFASTDRPQDLAAPFVAIVSALAALAAWLLLVVLERFTARPRTIWVAVATVVLLVSLGGPLSGHGISAANRVALVAMHLAVAAVVIPLLYRSAPAPSERSG